MTARARSVVWTATSQGARAATPAGCATRSVVACPSTPPPPPPCDRRAAPSGDAPPRVLSLPDSRGLRPTACGLTAVQGSDGWLRLVANQVAGCARRPADRESEPERFSASGGALSSSRLRCPASQGLRAVVSEAERLSLLEARVEPLIESPALRNCIGASLRRLRPSR